MGYYLAGFEVVGVDNKLQPHYPFEFHQADALTCSLEDFDAYHAGPPCQKWCKAFNPVTGRGEWPDLINDIRKRFITMGKPYVIENVREAPLQATLMLCGTMFGLNVIRHRYFEIEPSGLFSPFTCAHTKKAAPQGKAPIEDKEYHVVTGHFSGIASARKAMGIDWTIGRELAEATPPIYTKYIGAYLLRVLKDGLNDRGGRGLILPGGIKGVSWASQGLLI